jgi:hypothetical protein
MSVEDLMESREKSEASEGGEAEFSMSSPWGRELTLGGVEEDLVLEGEPIPC